MFMNITCPACGHRCRVPERSLGQQVVCPMCSQPFQCGSVSPPSLTAHSVAPEKPSNAQELPHVRPVQIQPESSIHYRCGRCNKLLESAAHLAGHKLNCPDCGQRLQIPHASPVPVSAVRSVPHPSVEEEPILTVLPASLPAPAAPVRREYCLECGVEVTRRERVQTCPDCGSLLCSARCYRDHCSHAHPRHHR